MEIRFSEHARYQMRERNIPEAVVRDAVENPIKVFRQSEIRFRALAFSRRDNRRYAIVVIYDNISVSDIEIVTVFYTSKIKKYL